MIESRSPQTISVGSRAASASRSLRADALAARLDDRAHGVQERLARAGVVERREAAREHLDVAAGREPRAPQQPAAPRPTPSSAARGEHGRTQSAPGSAAARSSRWTSRPEAAAGDEHEALAALGELVGELHRDAAAERVADDRRALVAERGQQVAHAAGVRAERVVAARRRRLAVAEQVGRDQREVLAQRRATGSHVSDEFVIPCSSRSTGPGPALR